MIDLIVKTTILTTPAEFSTLSSDWDDLLERTDNAPFFMRYAYQHSWWQYFGNDDLKLITVRTDDNQLIGLAPLYGASDKAQQKLAIVGCVDISDYLDLLIDRNYVDAVQTVLLDIFEQERVAWEILYLCSLPHNTTTHQQLAEQAKQRGWRVEVTQQNVCPVITLPNSWDDYLAGLDKKQRHEVRRKIRKLEREATVNWYAIESPDEVDAAMIDFIDLHQKSTPDKEDFWDDTLIRFFKHFVKTAAENNWLKLYFLEMNGERVATMLCFDYDNQFLLYNSGFNPDYFKLSVGNVLTAYTIQDAIRLGRKRYDFLRGDEIYKFRFGAVAEPVYDMTIWRQ